MALQGHLKWVGLVKLLPPLEMLLTFQCRTTGTPLVAMFPNPYSSIPRKSSSILVYEMWVTTMSYWMTVGQTAETRMGI